jgi:hypothetical protein
MTELAFKKIAYDENQWRKDRRDYNPDRVLRRARREIQDTSTPVYDLPSSQSYLRRFGEVEDLKLLFRLLARRFDLDAQLVDMTGETIRLLQEKTGLYEDIEHEEMMLTRLLAPLPARSDSRVVAVRRGKILAEARERSILDDEIRSKRLRIPHCYAMFFSVEELSDLKFEGILTADDDALWAAVQNRSFAAAARLRALDELIERDDADVPAFAVEELERGGALEEWRDGLLVVTERMTVLDPGLRNRLTRILLIHAQALRSGGASPALWAALRRYATLVPGNRAAEFLEFLDPAAPALSHQVVFQCIANVFSVEPPSDDAPLDALRARVAVLAAGYLSVRPLETGTQMSLARNAFTAAAALGSEDLGRLEGLLLEQRERWLVDAAIEPLQALAEAWTKAPGGDHTNAFRVVEASLRRLSATAQSST